MAGTSTPRSFSSVDKLVGRISVFFLAALTKPVPRNELHPAAVEADLSDPAPLDEVINAELADGETGPANAIRAMIQSVTVVPTPAGSTPGIAARAELGSLLDLNTFPDGPHVGGWWCRVPVSA